MLQQIIHDDLAKQLKNAYRKYKANIYYDNWASIQRQQLAKFEVDNFAKDGFFNLVEFDKFFNEFADELLHNPKELYGDILNNLNVLAVPKSVVNNDKKENVITNFNFSSSKVSKIHYFLDLPVKGHILGVLWILRCGFLLDDKLYKNCYGNRIRESVLNQLKGSNGGNGEWFDSCTPFLFMPYFKNYTNWRDNALDSINQLKNQEKHGVILSLDFKDYYYSSLIDFKNVWKDIEEVKKKLKDNKKEKIKDYFKSGNIIDKSLTDFIECVFINYSNLFEREGEYPMIPLGFLPSLIISNWNLQGFDQVILENISPYYYGRYVDDILIVLEVHEKSDSHGEQLINNLSLDDFIKKYFTVEGTQPYNEILKVIYESINNCEVENNNLQNQNKFNENDFIYGVYNLPNFPKVGDKEINDYYNYDNLRIQRKKSKIYLFSHKHSEAMINNFKREIRKNSSEFHFLHSVDTLTTSLEDNVHKIEYYESINKLKDIKNIKINKFEISKILSGINQIFLLLPHIDEKYVDEVVFAIEEHLLDYVSLWEKIFTLLYLNKNYNKLLKLIKKIKELIDDLKYVPDKYKSYEYQYKLKENNNNYDNNELYLKNTLTNILYCSLVRVVSLSLNNDAIDIYKYLYVDINDKSLSSDFSLNDEVIGGGLSKDFFKNINDIVFSSMQNSIYMRFPIQNTSNVLKNIRDFSLKRINEKEYDLVNDYLGEGIFEGIYPRYVKLHEVMLDSMHNKIFSNFDNFCKILCSKEFNRKSNLNTKDSDLFKKLQNDPNFKYLFLQTSNDNLKNNFEIIYKIYDKLNFLMPCTDLDNDGVVNKFNKYIKFPKKKEYEHNIEGYKIEKLEVGSDVKEKLKVGLVNTKLNEEYFENILKGKHNLFENRYEKLVKIVNEAIRNDVELLLMPEMYIPYNWVPKLLKVAKEQQMMMIFGVEPIEHDNIIKNYIMVALPFKVDDDYFECVILHRLKNEYAPNEICKIRKFKKMEPFKDFNDNIYYECIWNGIHIAPYYCFEITDIIARSLFKGRCDILTVSEFNKDVGYFDSIAESLARDLYCYCLKSNTSNYGGSEIIQPTKTETKIPVKLKGGEEDYLATHELDLRKLREEKLKSDLFHKDNQFKPKSASFKYKEE